MAPLDSVTTRSLPVTVKLFHAGGMTTPPPSVTEAALAVSVTTAASASSVTLTVAVLVVVSAWLLPAVELMLTVSPWCLDVGVCRPGVTATGTLLAPGAAHRS